MLKRLALGLVLGLIMGALVAAAVIKGLGVVTFGSFYAYVFAAVTGVLTGLVTGKPIWAKGAQIEAGLKAFFGALLGAGVMAAIRAWVHVDVDLSALAPNMSGSLGDMPAALPVIGALLGAAYEADNTPEPEQEKKGAEAKGSGKAQPGGSKTRVAKDESDDVEVDAAVDASKRTTRR